LERKVVAHWRRSRKYRLPSVRVPEFAILERQPNGIADQCNDLVHRTRAAFSNSREEGQHQSLVIGNRHRYLR